MAVLAVAATVAACNKPEDEPTPTAELGSFEIEMEYTWGMDGSPFVLSTPLYHPMTGDTLTFETFKHYVGNVALESVDGETVANADAYALFDVSEPSSLVLRVSDVPEGDYASMTLTLGVDSARIAVAVAHDVWTFIATGETSVWGSNEQRYRAGLLNRLGAQAFRRMAGKQRTWLPQAGFQRKAGKPTASGAASCWQPPAADSWDVLA